MTPIPGETYLVGGSGDLAMSHKEVVNKEVIFVKFTKGGLAYVQLGKHYYSIPKKNLVEI